MIRQDKLFLMPRFRFFYDVRYYVYACIYMHYFLDLECVLITVCKRPWFPLCTSQSHISSVQRFCILIDYAAFALHLQPTASGFLSQRNNVLYTNMMVSYARLNVVLVFGLDSCVRFLSSLLCWVVTGILYVGEPYPVHACDVSL